MGLLTLGKEGVKAGVKYGIPITYIKNLIKDLRNNPDMDIKSNLKNAFDLTGKDLGNAVKYVTGFFSQKKNMGGMTYARKKNMGLQMNAGGSVKSKKSKKKSRGTGAAIKGTKFKGIF
tara:strand:+ start:48 stop:401 length:354 start_codon:yes stop_codon:yes gene_type:complete